VRVAQDVDERMAATWYYIKERPDGQYSDRLKRYFGKAEPVFYKVRRRSMKGLAAYLRALPDGPHAKEALDELMGLREASRRDELVTRQARQSQLRLDVDRDKRKEAAELLMWWLSTLLDQAMWQAPLSQAPKDFIIRYRLSLPRPVCEAHEDDPSHRRCFKSVARGFRVAGDGKLVDRNLAFDLELELDDHWTLRRVTLAGSSLFLSRAEAAQERALDGEDEALRLKIAAAFVNDLTQTMLEREVACNGGTNADGNTSLDCGALRITLEPGRRGGDDVMFVERIAKAVADDVPDDDASAADDDDADDDAADGAGGAGAEEADDDGDARD
jgi:hypothetical protein